jgi:hypothetical protein
MNMTWNRDVIYDTPLMAVLLGALLALAVFSAVLVLSERFSNADKTED